MIPSSLYCSACGAANAADRSICFACKQPLSIAVSENTSLLQNRYRILTQVGKGGFGAVYRAKDMYKSGTIVAIKQIDLRSLTPQEIIEATDAFNREVSLLSHLDHPNLPHIYDNFTDPEHWYLVMDFIEGETLETYLEAKGTTYTTPLDEVLTLGIQLCTVLNYLHTREPIIIFRDLKPGNIMRTPANKLYLIDFGIARRFKPGKLKDTIPFGSPGYAAPEQYGKTQTTPRADIYSLGALLHRLLSGNDPADNPFHFAPLRIYGVLGLADLEALISRMVQLDANHRPATILEVKDELQRIADLQDTPRLWRPSVGQTPPPLSRINGRSGSPQISIASSGQQQLYIPPAQRTRSTRRKFIVGSIAIAGLTVIGAGGISNIIAAFQPQEEPTVGNDMGSTSQPQPTPTTPERDLFGSKYIYKGHPYPVQSVAWSSSGKFIASTSADRTIQLWTQQQVQVDKPDASKPHYTYHVITPTHQLAWGHKAFSENLIAFSQHNQMFLWDTSKGNSTFVIDAISEPVDGSSNSFIDNAFAWSPDGRYIAFCALGTLQIGDVVTERVTKYLKFGHNQMSSALSVTSLSWSSDGKYIAAGTTNGETVLWNVESGHTDVMTAIGNTCVTWSPDGKWLATVNGESVGVSSPTGTMFSSIFQQLNFNATALAWSPDSKCLVVGGQSGAGGANLVVWSLFPNIANVTPNGSSSALTANGNTYSLYFDTGGVDVNSLAWSPIGNYIAVGSNNAYLQQINTVMLNS